MALHHSKWKEKCEKKIKKSEKILSICSNHRSMQFKRPRRSHGSSLP